MEVTAAILLGYLMLGLQKIAQDLRAHPVDRPGWARQPSLKMACVVGLLWWWAAFRAPRLTARIFARALLGAISRLAAASGLIWGWYAAWGFVLSNTVARVIASVLSFVVLSPLLAAVLAVISTLLGLVVVAPISAVTDFLLRDDDPDDLDLGRGGKMTAKSLVVHPTHSERSDAEDKDSLEHASALTDELIDGETVAQQEQRLLAELDALDALARASRPWIGTTAGAEGRLGNSARVEEVPQRDSLEGIGSALAKITTTLNADEAKNQASLWGRILQAKPKIGPSACRFEMTALRMAAVMVAIEDVIRDGLDVPDAFLDSYENGLLIGFTELPYAKQLISSGHATDPEDLLNLGYMCRQAYLDAAKAPIGAERLAQIMVEFEARCSVEPGAIGLAAPNEFELLREFAEKKLRVSLSSADAER